MLVRLRDLDLDYRDFVVYAGFVAVLLFFSITLRDQGFLTAFNLLNIAQQSAATSIMAIGMVYALSAGEIDLSIGSTVALAALVTAVMLRDYGFVAGVLAGLGVGLAVGLANGLLVTRLRVPSFLITLATMSLIAGLARRLTNLEAVPVQDPMFRAIFGGGSVGPVPSLAIWVIVVGLFAHHVYRQRRFGAHVLATGDNRHAAEVAGIRTTRIRVSVLMISATSAALAGMLLAGRVAGARYTLGESELLIVIAAVIIGGTRLFGGKGTILGAIVGSLIMGILNNGLILMGLSVSDQMIFRGLIIVIAVAISLRERRA